MCDDPRPDDVVTFETDSNYGKYAVGDLEDIIRHTLASHGITLRVGSLTCYPLPVPKPKDEDAEAFFRDVLNDD